MALCLIFFSINTIRIWLIFYLWGYDRYDVALLYLEQAEYDLDAAVNTHLMDQLWEKEHPFMPASGGKLKQKLSGRRFGINSGFTS